MGVCEERGLDQKHPKVQFVSPFMECLLQDRFKSLLMSSLHPSLIFLFAEVTFSTILRGLRKSSSYSLKCISSITCFSCCCDRISDRRNLRREGFVWLTARSYSPSWPGRHQGRRPLKPPSRNEREECSNIQFYFSF